MILLRADQRQVASDPPLPSIKKEQILRGELSSLLTEEDYNLTMMVTIILIYNYLSFTSSKTSLNNVTMQSISHNSTGNVCVTSNILYGLLCVFFYILCKMLKHISLSTSSEYIHHFTCLSTLPQVALLV